MSFSIYSNTLGDDHAVVFPADLDLIIGSIPSCFQGTDIVHTLNQRFPKAHKHLATSCRGYFNQDQVHLDQSIALFGFLQVAITFHPCFA